MEYYWIGHCKEGTSDKIWGLIKLTSTGDSVWWSQSDFVAVWGRRGRKLQTKIHKDLGQYEVNKLCNRKIDGGYEVVGLDRLNEVYPEFEKDLESTALWARLKV